MSDPPNQSCEFDSLGERVIQPKAGATFIIYDPGLRHTAPYRSSISTVDGDSGTLRYRGTDIAEIWQQSPRLVLRQLCAVEYDSAVTDYPFTTDERLCVAALLERLQLADTISAFSIVALALENLGALETPQAFFRMHKLLFLLLTHDGPRDAIDFDSNSYQCFMRSEGPEWLLQRMATNLHAEHGISCSTNVVRCVASAGGNFTSAVLAGVEAFKSPLHGGASQNVTELVASVVSSGLPVSSYLDSVQSSGRRVPGLGHRIYRTWDPRAKIMFDYIVAHPDLFDAAERQVVSDIVFYADSQYFRRRKICPNPDLFNGIIFKKAFSSFDGNVAPLCFSRMLGWFAHYLEEVASGGPIVRPTHVEP